MKRGRKALAAEKEDCKGPLAAHVGRNPEAFHLALSVKTLCGTYPAGKDFFPPFEKFVVRAVNHGLKFGKPIANEQAAFFRHLALLFAQDLCKISALGSDYLASMLKDVAELLRRDLPIADPFRHYLSAVLKQLYGPAPGAAVVIPNDVLDLLASHEVCVDESTVRKEVVKLGYKLRRRGVH